ncbi:MAG: NfeD family protein [Erysipelotrichaceae bacterium]|nr:NfeD family protein [Erysipelotrichaceae bacterium]
MNAIYWVFIALATLIIEIINPANLICIWFVGGAVCAAIVSKLGASLFWQVLAFFAVSLITMYVTRPLAQKMMRGNVEPTNTDRLIGKTAVLTREITPSSWGELTIFGQTWSTVSHDQQPIPAGTTVKIVAIDGAKLMVRPLDD